jgi:hypothetical protein
MADMKYPIHITATDDTDQTFKKVEKKLSTLPKKTAGAASKSMGQIDRITAKSGRGIISTFAQVERASQNALGGGRSGSRGIISGLSQVSRAGDSAAASMGEAAATGGILDAAFGAIATGGALVIGVIGAVAAVTDKMVGSWAKGIVSAANMADTIGVATKALQEFQGAGERVGVDKGTSGGGLAGLSKSLNDARYGRNQGALAVLGKLGIKLQTKDGGDVDVEAMIPVIADAVRNQKGASGRRTIAGALGFGEGALPIFTQGGASLKRDMDDVGIHGAVTADGSPAKARRWLRSRTMVGQQIEHGWDRAGALGADATQGMVDRAQRFGGHLIDSGGTNIASAMENFGKAVLDEFRPAVREFADAVGLSGMRGGKDNLSARDVLNMKKAVQTEWDGRSVMQGRGIIDTILNRQASGHWGRTVADVVNYRSQFSNINGAVAWREGRHSVDQIPAGRVTARTSSLVDSWLAARAAGAKSSIGDNLNYANPNYSDARNLPWISAMSGPTYGSGKSIHKYGTTSGNERYRPGDFAVALPQSIPVEVHVKFSGDVPKGVTTTVTAGRGPRPAISHAFPGGG